MVVFGTYDVKAYYVQESTYATLPANPNWVFVASAQNLDPVESRGKSSLFSFDQNRAPRWAPYMEKNYDYKVAYYPHDIDLLTSALTSVNTSFSFEERWTPQAGVASDERFYRHRGCKAARSTITWKIGQPIEITTEYMFADVGSVGAVTSGGYPETNVVSGAVYGTGPVTNPFLFSDTPIAIDPTTASGTTTGTFTNIHVLEGTLTINNRLARAEGFSVGFNSLQSLPIGRLEATFEITRLFEDQNQIDQFFKIIGAASSTSAEQGTQFRIFFPLGPSHSITINNAKWNPMNLPKDVKRDILTFKFAGEMLQPAAGGAGLTLA